MTLLDAPPYDARRARLYRNIGIGVLIFLVLLGPALWYFWDLPQEYRVNRFLKSVEKGDLVTAYAIWNHDPDWQRHPEKYSYYDFGRFQLDWGPSSDYGIIKSHKILMAKTYGNGVVVGVTINGGKTPLFLRVDHKEKTVGFSPVELYSGP